MRSTLIAALAVAAALFSASFFPEPRSTGIADLDATNAIAARYGQAASALYVFQANDLFSVQSLTELKAFTQELKTSGSCRGVLSFFALPVIAAQDDATEVRDLVEKLPATEAEAQALRARVLAHPNGRGDLLSDDAKSTLIVCPLLAGKSVSLHPEWRVDPTFVTAAMARDLRLGAALFAGLALLLALLARHSSARATAWVPVASLLLLLYVAPAWWTNPNGTTLGRALGPSASASLAKLAAVTHADRTLLLSIDTDANTADGVREIQRTCDELQPFGAVRCPTQVLATMAEALTGTSSLPATNEQVKALWFFGGDRPELEMVFGADKHSALIRVLLDGPLQDEAKLRALAAQHHAVLGGLPLLTASDFVLPAALLLLCSFALAWLLRPQPALGVSLAAAALAIPAGLFAWPVALAGAGICAARALAPSGKTREGPRS